MKRISDRIYYKDQTSASTIRAQHANAEAWVKAYQNFEDDLVWRGVDTDDPKNYGTFYARSRSPVPKSTVSERTTDWLRHHNSELTIGAVVLAIVGGPVVVGMIVSRRTYEAAKSPHEHMSIVVKLIKYLLKS